MSALYLLSSAVGASVTIREGTPGGFAGKKGGRSAPAGSLVGTALSPGPATLAAQLLFTVLGTRGGKAGTAGLTALGVGATVGMLGEPAAYSVFSPDSFDAPKAALVSALVAFPALTAFLGARRLLRR